MVMIFAFAAFTIDFGYIVLMKSKLQMAADAGSLASAQVMSDGTANQSEAKSIAVDIASQNVPEFEGVVTNSDVVFGIWDADSRTFSPSTQNPNAVQVTASVDAEHGNSLELFFASVMGHGYTDLSETSIASLSTPSAPVVRFMIDGDMIDTDVKSIEDLGDGESVITDNDGDGYIDIPPGTELEVPSGQVGGKALFHFMLRFPNPKSMRFFRPCLVCKQGHEHQQADQELVTRLKSMW